MTQHVNARRRRRRFHNPISLGTLHAPLYYVEAVFFAKGHVENESVPQQNSLLSWRHSIAVTK